MLTLPATLTIAEARATLARLAQDATAESGAELTLDASALARFDTSALAVLLECKRIAQARGKRFALLHAPARLVDLARLYGIGPLLMP
ncbi:MAG: STAS domain-containing protein [Burkholderiaceae bacterium]|nr:STAS domain-containing protein [Burkholderiaceae bacterium]